MHIDVHFHPCLIYQLQYNGGKCHETCTMMYILYISKHFVSSFPCTFSLFTLLHPCYLSYTTPNTAKVYMEVVFKRKKPKCILFVNIIYSPADLAYYRCMATYSMKRYHLVEYTIKNPMALSDQMLSCTLKKISWVANVVSMSSKLVLVYPINTLQLCRVSHLVTAGDTIEAKVST